MAGISLGEYSAGGRALTVKDIQAGAKVAPQRQPTRTARSPLQAAILRMGGTAPTPTSAGSLGPNIQATAGTKPGQMPPNLAGAGGTTATRTYTPTPTGTGGGGGGGGYGGGDGGGGAPAPSGTTDGAGAPSLGDASGAALQSEIAALQAQYGLTIAQIAAMGGEIGARAAFLMEQLKRQQGLEEEGAVSALLSRGVFRSGITARDLSRIGEMFSERRSEVEMDKNRQLRELEGQRGQAGINYAQGMGQAGADIEGDNTEAEMAEMANTGQVPQGFLGGVQAQRSSGGAAVSGPPGATQAGRPAGPAGANYIQPRAGGRGAAMGIQGGGQFQGAGTSPAGTGLTTDRWMQMQGQGVANKQFGVGDFLDVRPTNQVVGGDGQGGQVYGGGGEIGRGAMRGAAGALGQAYYGTKPVSVDSFLGSLGGDVSKGITPQDIENLRKAYGQSGIDPAAAFNIASRASYIGSR